MTMTMQEETRLVAAWRLAARRALELQVSARAATRDAHLAAEDLRAWRRARQAQAARAR